MHRLHLHRIPTAAGPPGGRLAVPAAFPAAAVLGNEVITQHGESVSKPHPKNGVKHLIESAQTLK